MQLNHIARIFVEDDCLPVFTSAFDAAEKFFEHPWAYVAHAADNHLVTAAAYFPNPPGKDSAVARSVNQARHVSGTIANQRHHVARQRGVNHFAKSVLADIIKLE